MTIKLKISDFVIKRLVKIQNQISGGLFGLMYNQTLIVLGFNIETPNEPLKYKKLQDNFPTEVDLCGLIKFGECSDAEAHLTEIIKDIDITDNPILLKCNADKQLQASIFKHGQLEEIGYEVMGADELYTEFFFCRLIGELEVFCADNEKSVHECMVRLRKKLASGNVAFCPQASNVVITSNSVVGFSDSAMMGELLSAVSGVDAPVKSKKAVVATEFEVMRLRLLLKHSKDVGEENLPRNAPTVTVDKTNVSNLVKIPLKIDALSMLHRTTNVTLLYDILVESVCRTLRLLEQNLINQLRHRTEIAEFGVPQTYHFMPNEFGHLFTCIYPMTVKDYDYYLANKRKNFHHLFGLAINRPYFRRANAYLFKDANAAKLLVNPHVGLKSQVADGRQYLVQGKYTYHHYMQDNFDDNGWGCAYRSLQTLCSWFRFQGYSAHPIPTHKDIQKCLVDAGDKPKTFIGSRLWIGSTEVSICLNTFMDVDSKIMHVGSGGDLASKGAELAFHFETQGTPIMIGGGVLAHTILGVDYNSSTGDIRFLILDPHYTGADELTTVQSKGWCAWKNAGFWDKKSYYNLCMPQKPAMY